MFGRSKVKVNSKSGTSKLNHLFFGPFSTFPPNVVIIIAQLIIDIKDIKLEYLLFSGVFLENDCYDIPEL